MDEKESQERRAVITEAISWLKTPYHSLAKVKGAGVDCGQFLIAVFENVGLIPPTDTGFYTPDWHFHRDDERYLGFVETFAKRIPGPPLPADIVLFKFGRVISHGAIVIEWPRIIHAYRRLYEGMVMYDDAINNQALEKRIQQDDVGEKVFYSVWAR